MSLVKNSLLYLISTILVKATTFFLLPLYSYLVTPEEYGYVYIVSATSSLMMLFMQLSTQVCISRFLFDCKHEDDVKRLFSTIVFTVAGFSTFIFIIVWIFGPTISEFINLPLTYFRIACLIPYMGLFYNLILALLYAKQDAKKVSITSAVVGILNIVIQLILVFKMNDKAMALMLSMLLNSVITFCIFLIYSRPFIILSYDLKYIGKYMYYALSQLPSDLSAWLVSCTDRVVINKYIGASQTGIYGVGTTIGTIPSVIYYSMNQAYVPFAYSKFKDIEKGRNEGRFEFERATEILSAVVIIVISFFILFSNNIVNIFSPSYSSSFFIVVVMLMASMFDIFRVIYMQPLCFNIKFTKIKSAIWLISGLLNMGLNFIIIPRYGIYGGCLTSLVTYIITFGLLLHFSHKAITLVYKWTKIIKLGVLSIILYTSLLFGPDFDVLMLKITLFFLYIFISDKILDLKLLKYINNYVKGYINKRK